MPLVRGMPTVKRDTVNYVLVGAVVAVAISVLGQLLLAVFAGAVVFDDALGGTVTGRIG